MNKKLSGLIGIILSILLLMYFEEYTYKIIGILGINIYNYSNIVQVILNIIIKLIMCFLIYIIYKKDFKSRRRTNDNLIKNLLVFVVSLVSIVIGMYLFNYVINFIGDIFNISIIENSFYNIFNKTLDINLIIKIITDYIITPFLYCSVIILSVDKLVRSTNTSIIMSGVIASIIYSGHLNGTLGFVIVNSLNMFLLFSIFMYIYKKNYSIYFVITLYSFYLISNVFILNYLGW